MNRKEKFTAAIDKNRFALLRIVGCWLIALYVLADARLMPRCLRHWICVHVTKAEMAADCLVIATAKLLAGRHISIPQAMPQRLAFANALDARTLQRRLLRIQHKLLNSPKYAARLIHRAKLQSDCTARNAVGQASAPRHLNHFQPTALTAFDLSQYHSTRPP